jgi:uncharacterized protein (TIGR00251 family)
VLLTVHVTPRSGVDEVVGWRGEVLAVRVTAAPEGGRANVAVCKLLSKTLRLPKSGVRVVRGTTGRTKVLEVDADEEALHRALGVPPLD